MTNTASPLSRYVDVNERLLWSGQPRRGIQFRYSDWWNVPFGIIGLAFIGFWNYMVYQIPDTAGPSALFALFFQIGGAVFGVFALYFAIGRFFYQAMVRAHTFYGITDKRIMILETEPRWRLQSALLSNVGPIDLRMGSNQSGTIAFPSLLPAFSWWFWLGPRWDDGQPKCLCFEFIDNAKGVYDILFATQISDERSRPPKPSILETEKT